MSGSYVAVFAAGVILCMALTPLVRKVAVRWGAIDQPGERKIHKQPIPRLGGVAVLAAVAIVVISALWLIPEIRPAIAGSLGAVRWSALGVAALLVVLMGTVDDFAGLPARTKFLIEVAAAAAVVLVAGAPFAIDFSPFAFSVHLGLLEPIIGILWIVAITNAVNLMDVVDGVAAGVSAIAAAALAMMSLAIGNPVAATVLLALSGALIGFLPHNFRTRKVFLGDTGSLGVGFILGAASLVGLKQGDTWLAVPAVLALALPLTEVTLTVLRRTLHGLTVERAAGPSERFVLRANGPGLFTADQRHIPHRLLEMGFGKPHAVAVLYAAGGALGVLGFSAILWPEAGPFVGLIAIAFIVYFAPRRLYHELRVLERGALLPLLENRFLKRRSVHLAYDAIIVFAACLAAEAIVRGPSTVLAAGMGPLVRAAICTAAALSGFWLAGLYRAAYRHAGITEALRASRAVVLGMVLAAGALLLSGWQPQLATWLVNLLLVLVGVGAARLSFRVLDHLYLQGRPGERRGLIFGAGRGGDLALREIRANPTLGIEPVGFVDDDVGKSGRWFHGLEVHEGDQLRSLLGDLQVSDVVVSTRKIDLVRYEELAEQCRTAGVRMISFDLHWAELNGDGSELLISEPGLGATIKADAQASTPPEGTARTVADDG
jgi:UDP-GlcNAc:undecaprenyl-phosphate GlcNAc-1-phosphate transferase